MAFYSISIVDRYPQLTLKDVIFADAIFANFMNFGQFWVNLIPPKFQLKRFHENLCTQKTLNSQISELFQTYDEKEDKKRQFFINCLFLYKNTSKYKIITENIFFFKCLYAKNNFHGVFRGCQFIKINSYSKLFDSRKLLLLRIFTWKNHAQSKLKRLR